MVELRARFDEQNNIDWSKQLEDAGCTVFYGFDDYKVHSKLTLITSRVNGQYKYLTQIGTGNYNEKTSELYTDLSFITTRQEIGEEASAVFNNMALQRLTSEADTMLVARCASRPCCSRKWTVRSRWPCRASRVHHPEKQLHQRPADHRQDQRGKLCGCPCRHDRARHLLRACRCAGPH